jgi:hypothetical protein
VPRNDDALTVSEPSSKPIRLGVTRSSRAGSWSVPDGEPQLWARFDGGLAVQALQGQGEFFIAGVTWRDQHDNLVVLRQLVLWADDRERWPTALDAVEASLRQAVEADDFQSVLGRAWAALLVGDDTHESLLSDAAARLARDAATLSGYPPETQAIAEAVQERLGADAE